MCACLCVHASLFLLHSPSQVINAFQQSRSWRQAIDLLPGCPSNVVATSAVLSSIPWPRALQLWHQLSPPNLVATTAVTTAVVAAEWRFEAAGVAAQELMEEMQGRAGAALGKRWRCQMFLLLKDGLDGVLAVPLCIGFPAKAT